MSGNTMNDSQRAISADGEAELAHLARSKRSVVRLQVAQNRSASIETLQELAKDPDAGVRQAAIAQLSRRPVEELTGGREEAPVPQLAATVSGGVSPAWMGGPKYEYSASHVTEPVSSSQRPPSSPSRSLSRSGGLKDGLSGLHPWVKRALISLLIFPFAFGIRFFLASAFFASNEVSLADARDTVAVEWYAGKASSQAEICNALNGSSRAEVMQMLQNTYYAFVATHAALDDLSIGYTKSEFDDMLADFVNEECFSLSF